METPSAKTNSTDRLAMILKDVVALTRTVERRPYLQTAKYTIQSRAKTKIRVAKARNNVTTKMDEEEFWQKNRTVSHHLSPIQDNALSTFIGECGRLREAKLRALLVKKKPAKRNQPLITDMFKTTTATHTVVPGPREATEERMNKIRDVKEDKEFETKLINSLATLFCQFQLEGASSSKPKRVGRGEGEAFLVDDDDDVEEEEEEVNNDYDSGELDTGSDGEVDDIGKLLDKAKAVGKKLLSTLKVFVTTHRTHMKYCSVGVATLEMITEFATIFRREPNHVKRDSATHGLFDHTIRTETVQSCTDDHHGVTYYANNMKTNRMVEEYLVRRTLEFFFDPSIHIDWKYHGLATFHTASYLDAFRVSAQRMMVAQDMLDLFGHPGTLPREHVGRLLASRPDLNPYCILPIASRAVAFLRLGNKTPPHEITHTIWDYSMVPLASVNTGVPLDFSSSSSADFCQSTNYRGDFSPCTLGRRVAGMQYSKLTALLLGQTDVHVDATKRMNLNNWTLARCCCWPRFR